MKNLLSQLERVDFGQAFSFKDGKLLIVNTNCPYSVVDLTFGQEECFEDLQGWEVVSRGMSNQYGYKGAVFHESECLSNAIIYRLLDMTEEYKAFVMCVVEDEEDSQPIGWVILGLPIG